jgi:hypothetical protein
MIAISFLLIMLAAGVESLVCPTGQQPCGSIGCYDPTIQGCSNTNTTIQCVNSCNGTCYSNSQYGYNNTKVCNNGELVCNVTTNGYFQYFPSGPTCYNPSQYVCSNNTLCYPQYSCGTQCLVDYNSACANNRTICYGFYFWDYYYSNRYLNVCGPQQQCYDNTTTVCVHKTTICPGLNARLCGTKCFNPDTQTCTNGTIRCVNSCNGTCYSNSQYCYNNIKVCNNGELICNATTNGYFSYSSSGLTCYNSSQYVCSNNTLCSSQYSCGTQCLVDYNSACANNQTICSGFYYYNYNYYSNRYLSVCGPQQQCYDNTANVCLGNNDTLCPIGNQLCSGICYNPQSQYCIGGNNTIYCINNPLSTNCPATTNTRTTTLATSTCSGCCAVQNCTTNTDCCRPGSAECQCYRHSQTDVYGSCMNPYVTPICADSCTVQGKCMYDSDCCKCQCAEIRFTNSDGQLITKKQCTPR